MTGGERGGKEAEHEAEAGSPGMGGGGGAPRGGGRERGEEDPVTRPRSVHPSSALWPWAGQSLCSVSPVSKRGEPCLPASLVAQRSAGEPGTERGRRSPLSSFST